MESQSTLGRKEFALGRMLVKYGKSTGDALSVLVGKKMIEKGIGHIAEALSQHRKRGPALA